MKKNGKRYRKIQKEKERKALSKYRDISKLKINISQEVGDINTAYLSMAHIVVGNPIVKDQEDTKKEYLRRLCSYVKAGKWNRRKYEHAELCAYEHILSESTVIQERHGLDFYRYYILFDLMHVIGYELRGGSWEKMSAVMEKYYMDFPEMAEKKRKVEQLFSSFGERHKKLRQLAKDPEFAQEKQYIQRIRENLKFKKKQPFGVMVTATMSAGKSTFINALAGKYVCLSQNMACTSKIHCIVNKAFEDGFSYKYDHDLLMKAEHEELLQNSAENALDKIVVSTYFHGGLQDARVVINDSPGVNFSEDARHKEITDKLLKSRNYHLLIYVMNATQLATNDEDAHLDYVRQVAGRIPVLFVLNKIDTYNVEEENVAAAIIKQKEYLKKKGFQDPIVCPVSSKAGYLAKMYLEGSLSRSQERELYNYVDKFEQMNLVRYYTENFKDIHIQDAENEETQLLKTCGFAYVEKIIEGLTAGGRKNGTDLH